MIKDTEIEMFEDMLQEYFDKYKIYPKSEVNSRGLYGLTMLNGDYDIEGDYTYYFNLPDFSIHKKGIYIKIHIWRHSDFIEDINNDLSKFIYRIKKMGYQTDLHYDDTFGINFYISILDKNVKESH
jgi:hypothetical protein